MPRLVAGPPSHTAPSTYKLAPSEAFIPESVTATFDGTGAGGTFLPTLSIYSQDGKLIARSPATQITAGNSAEVTFAPLLRAAAAAAAASGVPPWALAPISGPKSIPTGVSTNVGFDDGTLLTDFATIYTLDDDGTGTFGLQIHQNGLYQAWWAMQFTDSAGVPVANPQNFIATGDEQSGTSSALKTGLLLGSLAARGYVNPGSGRSMWDVSWGDAFVVNSGTVAVTPIVMQALQSTGVAIRCYGNVFIQQMSTNTFGF